MSSMPAGPIKNLFMTREGNFEIVGTSIPITRGGAAAALDQHRPRPVVDLTERERLAYSISRAILKAETGESCFELEVSREIDRKLDPSVPRHGGIFVPSFMITRSGLDSKTTNKGAELMFTEPGSLVESLRAKAWVLRLGATFLAGLKLNVGFPKLSLGVASQWLSENAGVDVGAGSETFAADQVLLKPSQLVSPSIAVSYQLLRQATPAVDQIITNDISAGNALAIDKAALHGSGVPPEPLGLYAAAAGVTSVAMAGAVTRAKLADLEYTVANANGDIGPMGFITTPGVRKNARNIEVFTGNGGALWIGDNENGRMLDYPAAATNQVSKTLGAGSEHGIIYGAWSNLIVAEFGAMEIVLDPFTSKKQGMLELNSFLLAAIAIKHSESFAKGTGLTSA
jgi:HK97 family phage major capsid protein